MYSGTGFVDQICDSVRFNEHLFVQHDKKLFSEKSTCKLGGMDVSQYKPGKEASNAIRESNLKVLEVVQAGAKPFSFLVNMSDEEIGNVFSNFKFMKKEDLDRNFKFILNKAMSTAIEISELSREVQLIDDEINKANKVVVNCEHKIKKNSNLRDAHIIADDLAKKFFQKNNSKLDLKNEMKKSGLTDKEIAIIEKNSAGVHKAVDFLQNTKVDENAVIIGLNHKDVVNGLSESLKCKYYMDAYDELFHDFSYNEEFIKKLPDAYDQIVFLVPQNLLKYDNGNGCTASEMKYLLDNPEKMKNVHFVFSAYRIFKEGTVSKEIEESVSQRIFDQITNNMQNQKFNYDETSDVNELKTAKKLFKDLEEEKFMLSTRSIKRLAA